MLILISPDICRHIILTQDVETLDLLEGWTTRGDEIILSAITYAELVAGALNTANKEKHMNLVKAFCERLDAVVPWDEKAVNQYNEIQMQALANGTVTNMNNAMLVAHAISLNAMLLCMNKLHFADIDGVRLFELKES